MKHVWKQTRSLLAVLTACASLSALTASGQTVPPPAPYGALPSQGQLQWHEMEMYNMIEFNQINYLDKDWGWGDESPEIVNPVNFNAEEIVLRAKKAGSKGFLINAKHHGGFCMWPSRTTDYNISRSPWRNGKGDWVGEWEAACRKHGLKFGVYLSPWDRNTAKFGTPEYLDMFKAQLRELLTQYGDLFIIWFDGAPGEGGDGYYGGANEYRGGFLDYYDWENIYALCRELQPNAVIFGDPGPDVRWVGNEKGYAGETCWATLFAPGEKWNGRPIPSGAPEHIKRINEGNRNGQYWIPAEADFSLRIRFYAPVALAVSEVGCYKEPDGAVAPVISRTKAGEVSLQVERPVYQLRYTTDGSVPSVSSPLYTGPFTFAREGAVRAVAFDKDGRKGE